MRVLIVDDHPEIRTLLRELLDLEPEIEVVGEASDGSQAITACERCKPDAVIMDVQMPLMTGVEATRVIRGRCPDVRVIGYTAEPDHVTAMIEAGAVSCIPKTAGLDDLIDSLRAAATAA